MKHVIFGFLLAVCASASVGFRQLEVSDPLGKPLAVGIWYPANVPASSQPIGLFRQDVAVNAPVTGEKLPVVFISHGTAGSLASA